MLVFNKRNILHQIRKIPGLKKTLSKTNQQLTHNNSYFQKLIQSNFALIDSILNTGYYEYSKISFKNYSKTSKNASIEINNSCNINCVMCDTNSSTRKKELMNVNLFEDSIIKLKKFGTSSVTLHTIGDPLANAKLAEYFKILRKHKMRIGFLSTNGLLLHKHIETLIEYIDIVGNIRFSIDGIKKETYEKIRVGGNWDTLIKNLNLAKDKLLTKGFEFEFDFTITIENFSEMGEFLVYFKNFVYSQYKIKFNFMNSLAPSNKYFLINNVIPKHTHLNSFCKSVAQTMPYVLTDGKVSLCCRDYDGSLVVGDIRGNSNLSDNLNDSLKLKDLKESTVNGTINQNNYPLCSTCYVVDRRVEDIWRNTVEYLQYKLQDSKAKKYQDNFNKLLDCLNNLSKENYLKFIQQI